MITRFAPSTTGHAHPGTLLSALLCWLAARRSDGRVVLRLEDLDPLRCRAAWSDAMQEELAWFGLDWDEVHLQSAFRPLHEAALDRLETRGVLYPCSCSRTRLKAVGRPAPDGGFAYDNHCRHRPLPPGGWRACDEPLRVRLPDDVVHFTDESGLEISQIPSRDMGDPVVRRRDGAIAYHLASVVDDAAMKAELVIRGRDLAPSAPVQWLLRKLLDLPAPKHLHHFLLLEHHGGKLAKLHGSVAVPELRRHYRADELCGFLAHTAGLLEKPEPVVPAALVPLFDWRRVRRDDLVLMWNGRQLTRPGVTGP